MQVAVLFTVRLLWGNGIELLSCQSPVLLLLGWLLRLSTSTLKPQCLGNQQATQPQNYISLLEMLSEEKGRIVLAREMSMITALLSADAFNVWLPHRPQGCSSCFSHRNGDAGPALQKPSAVTGTPDWEQDTAQSRAQLRDHVPCLSLTQTLAPRLCHRNHGPRCPGAFQVSFLASQSCQSFSFPFI